MNYVVELDYEDESSDTVVIPASSPAEAYETARRDPEVVAARLLDEYRL